MASTVLFSTQKVYVVRRGQEIMTHKMEDHEAGIVACTNRQLAVEMRKQLNYHGRIRPIQFNDLLGHALAVDTPIYLRTEDDYINVREMYATKVATD